MNAWKELKEKYRALKTDINKSQTQLEKTYSITKPLKQLIETVCKTEPITTKIKTSTPQSAFQMSLHIKILNMTMK